MLHTNKSRGFTLIELMVVLAIIGILAAVLWPAIFGISSDKQTKAEQAMRIYVAQLFPDAPPDTRVVCATSSGGHYARCTARVTVSDGNYQLVEAECGITIGTQGCGPIRGRR